MSESVNIPSGASRAERYRLLVQQLPSLMDAKVGRTANAANAAAALMQALQFHWIGFYFVAVVEGTTELVLGPFQGPVACTRISSGKGVCGTAWQQGTSIVVPDVELFPGHIACSSLSRSEIVVPIFDGDRIIGVLDIDSAIEDDFSGEDRTMLEQIAKLLVPYL